VSIYDFPKPVTSVIADYVACFTLALLIPAILVGVLCGEQGRRHGGPAASRSTTTVLPVGYLLTVDGGTLVGPCCSPSCSLAGGIGHFFPISGGFSYGPHPELGLAVHLEPL